MNTSKVINVDENSAVFLLDLEGRIKLTKNFAQIKRLPIMSKNLLFTFWRIA